MTSKLKFSKKSFDEKKIITQVSTSAFGPVLL